MFKFLSQNLLVVLGLVLIAIYGITTFINSDIANGEALGNNTRLAGPPPEIVEDPPIQYQPEVEMPVRAQRGAAGKGFYDEEFDEIDSGDLLEDPPHLIDNTEGFDPNPDISQIPESTNNSPSPPPPGMSENGIVEFGNDPSFIFDNGEMGSEVN